MCGDCGDSTGDGAHWDKKASAHSNKNEETIEQLITAIRSRLAWIGVDFLDISEAKEEGLDGDEEEKSVRILDYGCGTGMISRALEPSITQAIGIDVSPNMVHEYNTSASTQSLTSKMSAFVGNLHDPTEPSPSAFQGEAFHGFDLAVVGLGFHHFSDPSHAAAKLAERLKTGGVLLILDFVVDEKSGEGGDSQNHGHGFWQKHGHGNGGVATAAKKGNQGGFGKEDIDKIFEGAGVGKDFGFEVIAKGAAFETEKHSMTADVFMARGTKA